MSPLGLALALIVGLSLGLLGGGGSILTLPILLYVVGLAPAPAIATSLLVVAGASLVATVAHARAGRVAWKVALSFAATSMTTAYLAGHLAHRIRAPWLLAAFTSIMLATGLAMLRGGNATTFRRASARTVLVSGAAVGTLTGLVGAGGGFLIVPALTMFARVEMAHAVGTSLLVITLNSLAGFAGYAGHVQLDWQLAGLLAAAAAVGSFSGSALSGRVRPALLRRGFALLVIAMSVWMAVQQTPPSLWLALREDARVTHLLALVIGAAMSYAARCRTPASLGLSGREQLR